MAQFQPAFEIVRQHEGNYANHPADTGGETYAGIARKIHPNWSGWVIIDFHKKTKGPIANNATVPGTEGKVIEFYKELWNKFRLGEVNSQEVANIFFDFIVLHSQAVRSMQQVLNASFGHNLVADNVIGSKTIAAINTTDPKKLVNRYKDKRVEMHKQRVKERPDQQIFLKTWLTRAASFGSGNNKTIMVILGVSALIWIIANTTITEKKKTKSQDK